MEQTKTLALLGLVVLLIIGSFSMFTVKETERAILLRLGEIVRTDYKPGLHFQVPLYNQVRKFDSRIMTLESMPERYLTGDRSNLMVDSFVLWRIDDLARYYTAVRGDETQAGLRLSQIMKDSLRREFGKRSIEEVVVGERSLITEIVTANMNKEAQEFGVKVVDVRVKRIDFPEDVSASVYNRMNADQARVARQLRSEGAEQAERIRAETDRQRTEILALAYRKAEESRGEGDGKAAEIYARTYQKHPEFYAFYRSMNAYRSTFKDPGDVLVLDPQGEFFKYFKNPRAK